MADTRNKINYFLEQVKYWLPYIIKDETRKQELKDALRRILASGEEQRKTQAAEGTVQERRVLQKAILDAFAKRVRPEISGPQYLQESGFGLPAGFNLPPNSLENLEKTIADAVQAEKLRQAGEIIPEELLQGMERGIGPEFTTQLSQDIIKQREAAKERPLEERRVVVEEAGIPLKEREVAVSEGQLKARWKELAGQIGDMTAKEARGELSDLGKERRKYKGMLQTKTTETGALLEPDQLDLIKSNVAEIKRLEDKINSKYGKTIEADYKAMANEIKAMRGTLESLDTNERLISDLTERGWNIEELKKYMK